MRVNCGRHSSTYQILIWSILVGRKSLGGPISDPGGNQNSEKIPHHCNNHNCVMLLINSSNRCMVASEFKSEIAKFIHLNYIILHILP